MANTPSKRSLSPLWARWDNPFSMMNDTFGDIFNRFESTSLSPRDWENFVLQPSIDMVDEKDCIKIEAEMPGMGPEDISISISDSMLTIKGEKTTAKKDQGKDYLKREIQYGSYMRTIPLPQTVDTEQVSASFKKGMLWVTLPKKSEIAKGERKVKIEEIK